MIKRFIDDYWFLSNFYPVDFKMDGIWYKSVEHFYCSLKTEDTEKQQYIREGRTPSEAKKISKLVKLRSDWEEIKLVVMEVGLRAKFHHPYLKEKLLETGDVEIQEGNTWNDTFWGINLITGEGENHLGKLLMEIRSDLRDLDG